jgi:hypothetical protein
MEAESNPETLAGALSAVHDVANSAVPLVDRAQPGADELLRRLELIASIARYGFDLRSPEEVARTSPRQPG